MNIIRKNIGAYCNGRDLSKKELNLFGRTRHMVDKKALLEIDDFASKRIRILSKTDNFIYLERGFFHIGRFIPYFTLDFFGIKKYFQRIK